MKVAILAGGFGSRLGELTRDRPKPMLEIAGRPYLEFVIESFAVCGLKEIVLLTGYRSDVVEEHFGDGSRIGVSIQYVVENEPLGTGGALRDAHALLGDRFVMTFGDVLRRFDYDRFVSEHTGHCLAVYPRRAAGNTAVDGGHVTRFDKHDPSLPFVDAGFALIESAALDFLPQTGACSFEEIVYPALAARGVLEAEIVDHDFFDIGTPEELARTRALLEVG